MPPTAEEKKIHQLVRAATQGPMKKLKELLAEGVDPNTADYDGDVALVSCCHWGKHKAVKVLLESGADPNAVQEEGMTGLMAAASSFDGPDYLTCLKHLLDAGAALDLQDEEKQTALHHSLERGVEVVRLLVEAGAPLGIKGFLDQTPAQRAEALGYVEVASFLNDWTAKNST